MRGCGIKLTRLGVSVGRRRVDAHRAPNATRRRNHAQAHAALHKPLLAPRPRQPPQQIPRHGRVPQVHADADARRDLHPHLGGGDAAAQRRGAGERGDAARPVREHGAQRDDGQQDERPDDEGAPLHGPVVLRHEAHEERDEGGLRDEEPDGGDVEEHVFEDDGEFDVGGRHGVEELGAEAVVGVECYDGVVGEEEALGWGVSGFT